MKRREAIVGLGACDRGILVLADPIPNTHRELIIKLANEHRTPAAYPYRVYVTSGGLLSYEPDRDDIYRRAAGYVDLVLKGADPGNLPVQLPVKYELAINLRTARALGLTVPPSLLPRADEVIE